MANEITIAIENVDEQVGKNAQTIRNRAYDLRVGLFLYLFAHYIFLSVSLIIQTIWLAWYGYWTVIYIIIAIRISGQGIVCFKHFGKFSAIVLLKGHLIDIFIVLFVGIFLMTLNVPGIRKSEEYVKTYFGDQNSYYDSLNGSIGSHIFFALSALLGFCIWQFNKELQNMYWNLAEEAYEILLQCTHGSKDLAKLTKKDKLQPIIFCSKMNLLYCAIVGFTFGIITYAKYVPV